MQRRRLVESIDRLYNGSSRAASRFRMSIVVIDLVLIAFFIAQPVLELRGPAIFVIDYVIAAYLIADLGARWLIDPNRLTLMARPTTWAELVVIASLLLAPLSQSLTFLRVLRTLRLLQSYEVLRTLRRRYRFFVRNERIIGASVNLFVFVYIVSAIVLVLQLGRNPQIDTYLDALYYTVATLTTTGFGDIVLTGVSGRLLSVAIMIGGVALFLRLVQTIFRPEQVLHTCPDCGLKEHDTDAIHCKHCGKLLNIETTGV